MLSQAASGAGGTWAYMAPEQHGPGSGGVQPAADMWGFGATMRHLLSGKPLPANWAILGRTPDLKLPAEAQAVPGLTNLLAQCLQVAPKARPCSAEALQRLHAMLHSSRSGSRHQNTPTAASIPELVRLLDSSSAGVQEMAAGALRSLAAGDPSNQVAIAQAGGVQPLVRLLDSSSTGVQEEAAGALASL
jgi:serine/threonine protein kinase